MKKFIIYLNHLKINTYINYNMAHDNVSDAEGNIMK